MKRGKKVLSATIILTMVLVLSIGIVSANWFTDLFKIGNNKEVKGNQGELNTISPKNVQLTVAGAAAAPEVVYISDMGYTAAGGAAPADRILSEDTYVVRNFQFCAYSTGGLVALPGTGGPAVVGTGATPNVLLTIRDVLNSPNREHKSTDSGGVACSFYQDMLAPTGTLTGYTTFNLRCYRCSVPVYYYDDYGSSGNPNWEIRAYVKDTWSQEDGYTPTDTMIKNLVDLPLVRTYFNRLDGYKMNPDGGTLDYGTVNYGNINKQPADSASPPIYPLRIRDTGNSHITQTKITAKNIPGVTDNTKYVLASWFTASPLATVCSAGNALVDSAAVDTGIPQINNAPAPTSESDLRLCLTNIQASATQQSYLATGGNAWTFGVTFG